jgi:Domain of unknown function (DUF927)
MAKKLQIKCCKGECEMTAKPTQVRGSYSIELTDEGVNVLFDNGTREHVADMIRITALGKGVQDRKAYSVVKFRDKDRIAQVEVVPTSLLTARPKSFVERMTDAHYIWPESKTHRERLVATLSAQNPKRRVDITMVPGWHGSRYVLPDRVISEDDWTCHFYRSHSVHLPVFVCTGGPEWKKQVAQYSTLSSRRDCPVLC